MTIETLTSFFMWCTIINGGLFLFWILIYLCAPDAVYRTQSKWFPISQEKFQVVYYGFMGIFKIFIIVFNLVPYVALLIIG